MHWFLADVKARINARRIDVSKDFVLQVSCLPEVLLVLANSMFKIEQIAFWIDQPLGD